MIWILKGYLLALIGLLACYMIRNFLFTLNRTFRPQKMGYEGLKNEDLPSISVLIPMHNEERVAAHILDTLVKAEYPRDKMEIIPIDDHSEDGTAELLKEYAKIYSFIHPLYRSGGNRGKPIGLNEGLDKAKGEIIIVFDADYLVPRNVLRDIAQCFKDPEVGAVMGRVIPVNVSRNLLTRLLDLERSGGYQVDQQARYNLGLIPQYAGTTAGFRKKLVVDIGGFHEEILAEDTDLTFRLFKRGWKVLYANGIECYEEVPEEWYVRGRQIRRWARGHTQVLFRRWKKLLVSPYLTRRAKLDGFFLLGIFLVPLLILIGIAVSIALFFLGELQLLAFLWLFLFTGGVYTFGNFAPYYQIGMAVSMDGSKEKVDLLPLFLFSFFFNMWYASVGSIEALLDLCMRRKPQWHKTRRYRVRGY